jgi:hypothetical protein
MRDVAKAMVRFSWAMSVFGLDQMRKLVVEEYSGHRAEQVKSALDSVSDSTERMFSERSRALYEAGDRLQQESIELIFDFARPRNWKASGVVDKAADAIDQSADALHEWAKGGKDDKPAREASGGQKKRRG